ncbi:MAG: glycosyltransferase [Pseudomonadota bacterium]
MKLHAKTPKVLLIGSGLAGGGAETRLRLLAEHLFGGTSDVAVFKNPHPRPDGTGKVFDLNWTSKSSYPRVGRQLRAILKSGHYDVAFALGLYQNALVWAASIGLKNRPALILSETTRPVTNANLDSGELVRRLRFAVYKTTYPRADLVAANSLDGVSEIVDHFGVPPERVCRIPNIVVKDDLFERAAQQANVVGAHPYPTFCMVTRLEPMKRVDTLIEAAAGLGQEKPWAIDIIGDGPHRTDLEDLVRALGINDRVRFVGWTSNPYPYVARSVATVLCSTYEGFSNTVLESMCLGTPVTTSLCSSDAKEMSDAGAALAFPVGDANALRVHLGMLLDDYDRREELRNTAQRYIEPHLVENAIPTYERLIANAMAVKASV